MIAINVAEVLDRLARVYGAEMDQVRADVAELGVFVSAVDDELAVYAAELRSRHYHRRRRPVSLADCCAAAHALDRDSTLVSFDAPLLSLMVDEGGRWTALPDSGGAVFAG